MAHVKVVKFKPAQYKVLRQVLNQGMDRQSLPSATISMPARAPNENAYKNDVASCTRTPSMAN